MHLRIASLGSAERLVLNASDLYASRMKTVILYLAGVLAFASATLSFIAGHTWPAILALLAGILAVSSTLIKLERP